jgi:hypothetical protein
VLDGGNSLGRECRATVGIDRDPDLSPERPSRYGLIADRTHQQTVVVSSKTDQPEGNTRYRR